MINWFSTGGIPDMSQEVASITTSLLAFSVAFIVFGVISYTIVKYYSLRSIDKDYWLDRPTNDKFFEHLKSIEDDLDIDKDYWKDRATKGIEEREETPKDIIKRIDSKVKGIINPITGELK